MKSIVGDKIKKSNRELSKSTLDKLIRFQKKGLSLRTMTNLLLLNNIACLGLSLTIIIIQDQSPLLLLGKVILIFNV